MVREGRDGIGENRGMACEGKKETRKEKGKGPEGEGGGEGDRRTPMKRRGEKRVTGIGINKEMVRKEGE